MHIILHTEMNSVVEKQSKPVVTLNGWNFCCPAIVHVGGKINLHIWFVKVVFFLILLMMVVLLDYILYVSKEAPNQYSLLGENHQFGEQYISIFIVVCFSLNCITANGKWEQLADALASRGMEPDVSSQHESKQHIHSLIQPSILYNQYPILGLGGNALGIQHTHIQHTYRLHRKTC